MNALSPRLCLEHITCLVKHKRFIFHIMLLVTFFVIFLTRLDGQVFTASVAGYVTDSKGAPIEEAAVTILNTGNKQLWETVTDPKGHYAFLQLMPGEYSLSGRTG